MSVNIYLSFIISSCWIWFWVLRISPTSSSLCWLAAASLNTMLKMCHSLSLNSIPLTRYTFVKMKKCTFREPQIPNCWGFYCEVWPLVPAALPGRSVTPPHGRQRGQRRLQRLQRRRGRHLGGELGQVLGQRSECPHPDIMSLPALLPGCCREDFKIEFQIIEFKCKIVILTISLK